MDLLIPNTGLVLWQLLIFVLLVFLLAKLAWKPILSSLKEREESIQTALDAAEKAKVEMAALKADNEKLLQEARSERDKILRDAHDAANRLHSQARTDAKLVADKMIDDAKAVIQSEKKSALLEVKSQVAELSLEIAGHVLRKNLSTDSSQKELAQKYLKEIGSN